VVLASSSQLEDHSTIFPQLRILSFERYLFGCSWPNLIKMTSQGNVFATDTILATLMTAPRSLYSWDIVVERFKDKIFLDKREDSEIGLNLVLICLR
jgi:hypothetical protein